MYSKELVGASTVPIILSVLSRGDNYGYAIIKEVLKFSDGQLDWSEPMLYPVLHRLEKKSLIQSEWRIIEGSRKRKYYSITNAGKEALNDKKEEWISMIQVFNQLWNLNPSQS